MIVVRLPFRVAGSIFLAIAAVFVCLAYGFSYVDKWLGYNFRAGR